MVPAAWLMRLCRSKGAPVTVRSWLAMARVPLPPRPRGPTPPTLMGPAVLGKRGGVRFWVVAAAALARGGWAGPVSGRGGWGRGGGGRWGGGRGGGGEGGG